MTELLTRFDLPTLQWVVSLPHGPVANWLCIGLSALGASGALWLIMAAGIAADRRGYAIMGAWRVALAVWLSLFVANQVLKPLVGRARPPLALAELGGVGLAPQSFSFPSGHAASAIAGAFALTLLWPRGRWLFWTLAALVAFSRLYLGVHYPTDVIAGALVGWACAVFATARTQTSARAPKAAGS